MMDGIVINRERMALLRAVDDGKVYRSHGGCDMQMVRAGQNKRVDRKLRELAQAGLVELAVRPWQLTADGETELAKAAAEYANIPRIRSR